MTPEEKRKAIAKLSGWTHEPAGKDSFGVAYAEFWRNEHATITALPDYLNDLNEIHKAVMSLTKEQREMVNHMLWQFFDISDTSDLDKAINATASKRADAFLEYMLEPDQKP